MKGEDVVFGLSRRQPNSQAGAGNRRGGESTGHKQARADGRSMGWTVGRTLTFKNRQRAVGPGIVRERERK